MVPVCVPINIQKLSQTGFIDNTHYTLVLKHMHYGIKIIHFVWPARYRSKFFFTNYRRICCESHTGRCVDLYFKCAIDTANLKSTAFFDASVFKYTHLLTKRFGRTGKATCINQSNCFFSYNRKCCKGMKPP